ncbi:hypothetical protein [Thalassomonas haliotis]|uniref:Lipoprotein n=1 Tax=Thalassomonas haliotis TaxID=485448 RepID=A0ABY7VGG0_9GAMM|nr:hypothetical protein [Thalassomonas haliotis]WDE12516.1 hypothetical protein H3N35_03265 [Thalassomonas haliotis]
MNINKKSTLVVLALSAALGLSACGDKNAEEAGEKVDELIADGKSVVRDAGDKAEEMATDAGNAIEDACEKAKEKAGAEDSDC